MIIAFSPLALLFLAFSFISSPSLLVFDLGSGRGSRREELRRNRKPQNNKNRKNKI
jgi:hypothetical protein